MRSLRNIDDAFVDEYIITHRTRLTKPTIGGTDWRFADIVAPAFKEILELSKAESILEIGFNIGGAALMFLSIDPTLRYCGTDIAYNRKSDYFFLNQFSDYKFVHLDSAEIQENKRYFAKQYDLVSIDGDHSEEAVRRDIETAFLFNPTHLLLDDVKHPSHSYIWEIITRDYADKLEVVKLFEFNQCWQGYSMALCKVKWQTEQK